MLKIAQKTDFALLIALALAEKPDQERVSLEELAKNAGISQGYLEEVAGLLRTAGIIVGRRGAGGGYVLARPAAEISLANIITAIEGARWSGECLGERGNAAKRSNAHVWRKVQGQMMSTLHQTSLADVMKQKS